MSNRVLPAVLALALIAAGVSSLCLDPGVRAAGKLTVPGDYASVQAAVNAAANGDVIVVTGGPYFESVILGGFDSLTIQGKKARIQAPSGPAIHVQGSSNVVVSGLALGSDGGPAFLAEDCSDLLLSKCMIDFTQGDGAVFLDCDRVTVTGCLVENVDGEGITFEGGSGAVVVKNRVFSTEGNGVSLSPFFGGDGTPDSLVSKNTILFAGDFGVVLGGQRIRVEKNRITAPDSGGIVTSASTYTANCVIEKNRIDKSGGNGIHLSGELHTLAGNRVSEPVGYGIEINGSQCTVTKNQVRSPGGNGYVVSGHDGLYEKNRVFGAGNNGFDVLGWSNRFTKNAAKGSGNFDLYDHSFSASNTYEKNRFATESILPPK